MLSEKDARSILMQILSGLRYLNKPYSFNNNNSGSSGSGSDTIGDTDNEDGVKNGLVMNIGGLKRRQAVIHYDLKPANILFDEMGDVKITGESRLPAWEWFLMTTTHSPFS